MRKLKPVKENLYQERIIYRKIKEYYDDILFNFIDRVFDENRFENDKQDAEGHWHSEKNGRFVSHVVKISGDEIGEFTGDRIDFFRKFEKYYKKHLSGQKESNPVIGDVYFENKDAIGETQHQNRKTVENLKYIAGVRDLIKYSRNVKPEAPRHYKKNVVRVWRIKGKIQLGNNEPRMVEVVVLEKTDKKKYYSFDARSEMEKENSLSLVDTATGSLKANSLAYDYNIPQNNLNVNIFIHPKTKIRLENAVDLRWYILQGYLRYRDGFFTIKRNIPNKVALELERMGARYIRKRRGYYLRADKIPPAILQAAAFVNIRDQERLTKISEYLRGLTETQEFISSKVDFSPEVIKIGADLDKQFKSSMKGLEIPPEMTEFQKSEIAKNYTNNLNYYIKKWIPKEIYSLRKDIEPLVLGGYRAESLEEIIQKHKGVSERKAKFLARQETKLLVAQYRKNRFKEAGVTQYIWSTVLDGKERDLHRDLNGRIFSWDEPPIIDARTGEKGAPGEAYNCRCIAVPVIA